MVLDDMVQQTTQAAESAGTVPVTSRRAMPLKKNGWRQDFKKNWVLYLIFVPAAVYFIVFNYIPMTGVVMAFQNVSISNDNYFANPWVGWLNFENLFAGGQLALLMRNTAIMCLLNITIGFLFPIVLALLVSEVKSKFFRRTVQTVTYMPYFLSAVIITQLVKAFVDDNGAITELLRLFGYSGGNLLENSGPPTFWFINMFMDVWQNAGYSSIVFVAAIMGVDKDLYEAAALDGANRFRRAWNITLPTILPIVVMMFTIKVGTVLNTGFDKVVLLYNDSIRETADCLYSYTYRMRASNTSLSAAAGLFQSVISTALLLLSNWLSRMVAKTSLF